MHGRQEKMAEKIAEQAAPIFKPTERVEDHWPNANPIAEKAKIEVVLDATPVTDGRRKRFYRRTAGYLIAAALLVGGLYGTAVFVRNSGIIPGFSNPFAAQVGVAKTDVNLRPEPNPNNDPLGVVTRNSRVRVVKREGDWYQVDVVEQGREVTPALPVDRGWLHGRYLEIEGN